MKYLMLVVGIISALSTFLTVFLLLNMFFFGGSINNHSFKGIFEIMREWFGW